MGTQSKNKMDKQKSQEMKEYWKKKKEFEEPKIEISLGKKKFKTSKNHRVISVEPYEENSKIHLPIPREFNGYFKNKDEIKIKLYK